MTKKYTQENQYIIDSIDATGYDKSPETTEEKLKFLRDTFYSEYTYDIKRVGELGAMKNWLMGLPSSINIEFENYKILQLAKAWGSLSEAATERQEDKLLANYWHFVATRILSLFKKYKIS